MFDAQAIDGVFRLLNREVWIVTAANGQRRGGLVATWVMQASLDPATPLVVAAIAPNHFTADLIRSSRAFALHLITTSQIRYAWPFALGSGRDHDKFAGLAPHAAVTGSPILPDCLAWLDCRVITRYDAGDRLLFWGEVVAGQQQCEGSPLRERELLAAATDEQRRILTENLHADIEVLRSPAARWRTAAALTAG